MNEKEGTKISLKENKKIILFCCLFFFLLCLFSFMNNNIEIYSSSVIQRSNQITANMVSGILNLIKIESCVSDRTINIAKGGALQIIYECTGIYLLIILSAFILSYPAMIRQKLVGLILFLPLIYLFNLFRIVTLGIIQIHWPQYLNFFHNYLWEATFIIIAMTLAYLWLLWVNGQLRRELRKSGKYLRPAIQFFFYSLLCYILLTIFFKQYLIVLQKLVNSVLSLFQDYWRQYRPMHLMVKNKELWLIYAKGRKQINDVPFIIHGLVTFTSLMLITRLRPKVKALGILSGGIILCSYHVFTLILVIQKLTQKWHFLWLLFRVYLLFLLPIILWIPFLYYSIKKYQKPEMATSIKGPAQIKKNLFKPKNTDTLELYFQRP